MEGYSERRPSFSSVNPKPFVPHRHSSATLFDFAPLHDAPGTSTPPLHAPATVPFKWEEEPGKPIASGGPKPARCLDPPPGSIMEVGRPKFSSSSRFFGEGKRGRGRGLFGKLKGGGGKREIEGGGGGGGNSGNSFSSNSSFECESDESCSGTGRKMRRHNSFSNLSHHHHHKSPHIWATLYGGLKQVVHWKSTRK